MIILELIITCHHFGGFRAGYPFFKTKHPKKGGSQEGSHPVPNLAGHGVVSWPTRFNRSDQLIQLEVEMVI